MQAVSHHSCQCGGNLIVQAMRGICKTSQDCQWLCGRIVRFWHGWWNNLAFTIPGWWNNLPTPIRNAGSLSIFKQQLKTHLFRHYLTSSLKKKKRKKKKRKSSLTLSFSPSLASLYLFEQWLRLGVTSTSSVWLPLQDESLYVFPNCKSLWIKVSAKWLNVNVNDGTHASATK